MKGTIMPQAASPIVFRHPHREAPNAPDALYSDPRYTCAYERTVMHWQNHKLDWFYQEQDIFQEKETGKYFWPHSGQMVEVTSLEKVMSHYFFEAPADYQD